MRSEDLLKKACRKLEVPYVPPTPGASETEDQERVTLLRQRIAGERGKALCTAKIGERLKNKNLVRQIICNKIGMPQVYNDLQRRASLLAAAIPIQPPAYNNFKTASMQPYQINKLNFLSSVNKSAITSPSGMATKSLLFSDALPLEVKQDIRKLSQSSHSPIVNYYTNTNRTANAGHSYNSLSYLTDTVSTDKNQHAECSHFEGNIHISTQTLLDAVRVASAEELLRLSGPLRDSSDSLLFSNVASSKSLGLLPPKKRYKSLSGNTNSAEDGNTKTSKQPPSYFPGDEIYFD